MSICLEWVDRLKQDALILLGMELRGQEGREPGDSQEPPEDVAVVRPSEEAPRRVEGPEVSPDVQQLSVLEGARRLVRPRVSRYVDIMEVPEEDQVETPRERRETETILQVQESETGEESGLSGEISEKDRAPERPKKKRKLRQHSLEEHLGWQQDQGRDSGQLSQDQEHHLEPYTEGTEQHYRSRVGKHKSLTASLLDRPKSQGKYHQERKSSQWNRLESSAQGASSLSPHPSRTTCQFVASPRSQAFRSSLAPPSSQALGVSPVSPVPMGLQVPLESQQSSQQSPTSTLKNESSGGTGEQELKSRRQTIRFSLRPKSSRRLSQRSFVAYNELAKLGDPDLLEMVEQEGKAGAEQAREPSSRGVSVGTLAAVGFCPGKVLSVVSPVLRHACQAGSGRHSVPLMHLCSRDLQPVTP